MAKKFKIKAKEKKGAVHVKAMFTSLMADAEEAEKKQIKPERITASVNDKLVFEADTSGFMSENPLLKFSFTGAKKGDKIVFTTVDNNDKTQTGSKKIK